MASGLKNSSGTDADDIYQVTPSSSYSAAYYLRNTGDPRFSGVKVDNNQAQITTTNGDNAFDRYVFEGHGTKASSSEDIKMEAMFTRLDSNGQDTGVPHEYISVHDVCAAKGSVGVPSFSPSSGSYSDSKSVSTIGPSKFSRSFARQASGNPPPTGYTVVSYSISGGSSDTSLNFDGAPTVNNSGNMTVNYDVISEGFGTGSDTYNVVVSIRASNAFGSSNTYTFNIAQTITWNNGGGGCFSRDTLVLMADGTEKQICKIKPSDKLKGACINGRIDESVDGWQDWQSNDLEYETVDVDVRHAFGAKYEYYYLINGELKVTFEHPFLVERNGTWSWVDTENLEIGDKFINGDMLNSKEKIEEPLDVITLDVEEVDNYFVKLNNAWVCAHNAPQKGGDPF